MDYKQQTFLTILEVGKSGIKMLAHLVSGESLVPGSQTAVFSLCPHMTDKGARELPGVPSEGH